VRQADYHFMLSLWRLLLNAALKRQLSVVFGVLGWTGDGLARMTGLHYVVGFETLTLFQSGITLMVLAFVL